MNHLVIVRSLPGSAHKLYQLRLGDTVIREQVSAFSEDDIRDALEQYAHPQEEQPLREPQRIYRIKWEDD